MDLKETKKLIRERMSLGLHHGIGSLEKVLVDEAPLLNEFITYKSQYHDFKNLMNQNLLNYSHIEVGLNKIRVSLLELVDRMSEEDLQEGTSVPGLRNTEIQYRKNNFFQLLEIHFQNLEAVRIDLSHSTGDNTHVESKIGRYAFDFIYRDCFVYEWKNPHYDFKFKTDFVGFCNDFYFSRYRRFEVYMRTLQMIMAFVMEEEMEKNFYLNILEAILSTQEMQTIFYYCISGNAEDFKSLLQETDLLTQRLQGKLIDEQHWDLWEQKKQS